MPSKPRTAGGKGGDYASLADEELISLVGRATLWPSTLSTGATPAPPTPSLTG